MWLPVQDWLSEAAKPLSANRVPKRRERRASNGKEWFSVEVFKTNKSVLVHAQDKDYCCSDSASTGDEMEFEVMNGTRFPDIVGDHECYDSDVSTADEMESEPQELRATSRRATLIRDGYQWLSIEEWRERCAAAPVNQEYTTLNDCDNISSGCDAASECGLAGSCNLAERGRRVIELSADDLGDYDCDVSEEPLPALRG